MTSIDRKVNCAKPGCRKWPKNDGSGFCLVHNPVGAEKRRAWAREVHRQRADLPADRKCGHEGCKKLRNGDGSGFCNFHDPDLEKRKQMRVKRAITLSNKVWLPERMCKLEGCKGARLRNGSKFCVNHDPVMIEAKKKTRRERVYPAEKFCSVTGCRNFVKNDGSGLCISHHKEFIEMQRTRKGSKHNKGRHLPWLGLENFEEALGLIFYSLETDQPLLTLRVLTKIASLHAHGQMYLPKRSDATEAAVNHALEEEKERPEMFYLDPASWEDK